MFRVFNRAVPVIVVTLVVGAPAVLAAADEWDVDAVYPDQAAWDAERAAIDELLTKIERYRLDEVRDSAALADLLTLVSSARGRAGKMAKVGSLQAYVDTTSQSAEARYREGLALEERSEERVAFVEPLILALGEKTVRRWLSQNEQLSLHERRINRIFRLAPYSAPSGSREIEAPLLRFARTGARLYSELLDSELSWPVFEADDEETVLTPAAFAGFRGSLNTNLRRRAHEAYLSHLGEYRDLFGQALVARLEGDLAIAQLRGLSDTVDRLLVLNDGFEPGAYQAMLPVMREAKPTFLRAFDALRRSYGLDEISTDDFLITSWSGEQSGVFALKPTMELIPEIVAPLGSEYQQLLASRLARPWYHLSDTPEKSRTTGVFWQVGGGHPHTIMRYRNDYPRARMLCGAALLMMGYASVPENLTPDRREEDLPVFSNALWYLGRFMYDASSEAVATGDEEYIAMLTYRLASMMYSLVSNALVTEFEHTLSEHVHAGTPLDGEFISNTYRELLEAYYGGGSIRIPDHASDAWMNLGTLFYGPHQTSWSLAYAAALALHNRIQAGDDRAIVAVREGIGRSATHFSSDVLADAGLDMSDPDTYRHAIAELEELVSELEAVLARAGR